MSLRMFHLIFVLVAMVMADMFGAWAIWHYPLTHDVLSLWLGVGTLLGGLALAGYALVLVRQLDQAHVV